MLVYERINYKFNSVRTRHFWTAEYDIKVGSILYHRFGDRYFSVSFFGKRIDFLCFMYQIAHILSAIRLEFVPIPKLASLKV